MRQEGMMVTMTCPWCDEDSALSLTTLLGTEAAFTCASCGTTVLFTEEPAVELDLAA
jgi:transposase-like protein